MPFCGECGAKLEVSAKFCGECGTPTPASSAALAPQVVKAADPAPQPVKAAAPSTPARTTVAPSAVAASSDDSSTGDRPRFESPHMQKMADALPKEEPKPKYSTYVEDKTYKLKVANKGITKHVNKLWAEGSEILSEKTTTTTEVDIKSVFQYLASPTMMNNYQEYFNDMEKEGYGLQNDHKRLQTAQVFFAPETKEKLEKLLKDGFSSLMSMSFYKNPIQCIEESHSKINALLQCRILLVRHQEINNKYILKSGKGVMPGFLIEYDAK